LYAFGAAFLVFVTLQVRDLLRVTEQPQLVTSSTVMHQPVLRNPHDHDQCRFYLAESAIQSEKAGLGIFAGVGLLKGDMIGVPDICIFVSDAPKKWTHLRSHTFGWASFFGQYEGSNSRAACEGIATTFNTMPNSHINAKLVSPIQPTNAGLERAAQPGAGAITHHFGMHAVALDVIPAGSELTIDYGDWDFDPNEKYVKPLHSVEKLEKDGWCIDNLEVRQSFLPMAGRGAFAKRFLAAGTVIAPAPLQCFKDRKIFQKTEPEQLYVNYCLQPRDSKMIFYPYGTVVNLINHSKERANVHWQWSKNKMHHADWLKMSYDEFWDVTSPGGLILEIVASRDISPGEELFLDYGDAWEEAWNHHVEAWTPPAGAEDYVYPEDMSETDTLRTVKEQKENPYPKNLALMCNTPAWTDRKNKHMVWHEPKWDWQEGMAYMMAYCHVLKRDKAENGDDIYTVSLTFHKDKAKKADLEYDDSVPLEEQYIDYKVPRRAIRWIEKPYYDDEHLKNAFRHPIEFPENLVPDAWKTEL
jgi:hypothetical protein